MTEIEIDNINSGKIDQARLSDDGFSIIDSDGQKVDLDDPRIIHVLPEPRNPYGRHIVINLYKSYNRNVRISKDTNAEILQYGKKICSGRECLASVAIAGGVLKDITEYRTENEITLYHTPIEQHGPCQNGGWPVLWKTFSKRLNVKNIILYVAPNFRNKYLGLNSDLTAWENIGFQIGHYLTEARNALQCVADNASSSMKIFEKTTSVFIESLKEGVSKLRTGLVRWAKEIRKIPLKAKVEEIPKVLIFGGLNLLFLHYPVEDFFLKMGIIPKVVDLAESLAFIVSESILRFGFKRGLISPQEQFDESLIDYSKLNNKNRGEVDKVIRNRKKMDFIDTQCLVFKRLIGKSGLLFDPHLSFLDLLEEGNKYITSNSCTETTLITGRFSNTIKMGVYDGLVNLGTFNCQPAMNSQAIIRPLANKSNIPYAAVDCEGPSLSTNQLRLLETIAIQAKRIRIKKNEEKS